MLGTIAIFFAASALIVALWNRWLPRVPWRVLGIFWLLCVVYQAETLFTSKVDLRGVATNVYPWKSLGLEGVGSNTGIVFTQLGPWTRIARDQLKAGELPLWNRHSASGAPLLANQQTAIFHPFTLLGLPLTVGKAFTLSATLRLFALLFFMFVFLRGWDIRTEAAVFGAVAYAFCTFHIVWLLFPLGLATMMLPIALVGAQLIERRAGLVVLVLGLSLSVLGGHPESALWVWITTAAFVLYRRKRVALAASAFIVSMLLTAFFWYPTLRALQTTSRYQAFKAHNPADHGLSYEWLLPLVTPNVLGNPYDETYEPPRGAHPAVLNDYGEVASSYAGLITLALALVAPFVARRKPLGFALGLMLFALLSIAEAPLWSDLLRATPLVGISLHQRLRVLWDLGVCIAAALSADKLLLPLVRPSATFSPHAGRRPDLALAPQSGERRWPLLVALATTALAFAAIYAVRRPSFLAEHPLAVAQLCVPLLTVSIFALRPDVRVASLLVLADLVVSTWRYNPPTERAHVYPITGAIHFLQATPKPSRMVAWGWSFLPETPGWYGIEDVKTTDPVQHFAYTFMFRGYLDAYESYDLIVRNVERPFVDYLNVRYLYVPPDHHVQPAGFVERYRGDDGVVLENMEALPRYFLARRSSVERDLGNTIARSRETTDYRDLALVESSPPDWPTELAGGEVRMAAYESNRTLLDIDSRGRNLLVTSDVNWAGWRAYWNGQPAEIVRVNGAFVGVFIPEGKGRLELRYLPRELVHGAWAGVGGVLLLAVLVVGRLRRGWTKTGMQNAE